MSASNEETQLPLGHVCVFVVAILFAARGVKESVIYKYDPKL